jgi:hypothetical protein
MSRQTALQRATRPSPIYLKISPCRRAAAQPVNEGRAAREPRFDVHVILKLKGEDARLSSNVSLPDFRSAPAARDSWRRFL